jgi:hypothetical protein
MKFHVFSQPIPFLLGTYVPQQFPAEALEGLPSWVATFLLGVWVAGWFAEKLGKFPKPIDPVAEVRDEKLINLLVTLTQKVDDLSKAVTELRVELAHKD